MQRVALKLYQTLLNKIQKRVVKTSFNVYENTTLIIKSQSLEIIILFPFIR